jgi:hypothetical protein
MGQFTDGNRINIPIGAVAAAMIFLSFSTPRAARPVPASLKEKFVQMDFVGSLSVMAAAIAFVLASPRPGAALPLLAVLLLSARFWRSSCSMNGEWEIEH